MKLRWPCFTKQELENLEETIEFVNIGYGQYILDQLMKPNVLLSLIPSETDFIDNTARFAYLDQQKPIPIIYKSFEKL